MGSEAIELLSPPFDHYLGFLQGVENLSVELCLLFIRVYADSCGLKTAFLGNGGRKAARYWAKISQRRHPGRPRIDAEIRRLVRTMAQDGWGAPRIHAELTKLGFIISEITVSRLKSPVPFHLVNYPISAVAWLRKLPEPGERSISEVAHIANRYRGGGMEVQEAKYRSFGPVTVEGPTGPVPGHRFELRYPGGWEDSTFEFWTDEQLVPLRLKMFAGEGELEYRLVSYTVHDEELLAVEGVPSIYSSASPWVGSQPCGAKYPGFCADSKGV